MPYYKVKRGEVDYTTKQMIGKAKLIWEGTDLMELERRFPRLYFSQHGRLAGNLDELRTVHGPRSITRTVFLCRERETDNWGVIEDPRFYLLRHVGQKTGGHRVEPKEVEKAKEVAG